MLNYINLLGVQLAHVGPINKYNNLGYSGFSFPFTTDVTVLFSLPKLTLALLEQMFLIHWTNCNGIRGLVAAVQVEKW